MKNKKIILGVCGSIAAYKSAEIVRLLIKSGAEVQVIMTNSALNFITPTTLSTLSKKPVFTQYIKNTRTGEWTNHVELGLWADAMLIAPATANSISKLAHGQCDDLLSAVYLSARCPVFIAPAMDLDMLNHQSTQNNIALLKKYGNQIIDAEEGELASGLFGKGRMAEPEHILNFLTQKLSKNSFFRNKKILITAGPTYEMLDPVRFIGNHSSGKMGYALADQLAGWGANVTLVSGPSSEKLHNNTIKIIKINSAEEMFEASSKNFKTSDIVIFAAAVSDYKPTKKSTQKIKKKESALTLDLTPNIDIAATLGKQKKQQFIVGFALETENEEVNALKKIREKNFDLIVLNSLNDPGAGFQHSTNKITIIDKDNNQQKYELKDKREVAKDIALEIVRRMKPTTTFV